MKEETADIIHHLLDIVISLLLCGLSFVLGVFVGISYILHIPVL